MTPKMAAPEMTPEVAVLELTPDVGKERRQAAERGLAIESKRETSVAAL